jgi:hypothetical protein
LLGFAATSPPQVTNFLGFSGSSTVGLEKLAWPVPVLSVQGNNPRLTTHSARLDLKVVAELPNVACVSGGLASAKMSFSWVETSGAYSGALSGTSKNPRMLSLAANALAAGQNYTFRALGWLTDDPSVNNTAAVVVVVQPEALLPAISGKL